jgi:segregation and condensation protein A
MAVTVKTDVFEGPFDLLLYLVSRQKLDVGAISVSEIADQYLAHIERMHDLDLEVASDFIVLAATLLEIKAAALLPEEAHFVGDELDDLEPEEARSILIARLLAYKQFKNVAAELAARMESEAKMHPRSAGLESRFLRLMPDYLEGITLHNLAVTCAELEHRRELFLLEAEHVASVPISLEDHATVVSHRLASEKKVWFADLVSDSPPDVFVVTFLAILELYKRAEAELRQEVPFGDILVEEIPQAERADRAFREPEVEGAIVADADAVMPAAIPEPDDVSGLATGSLEEDT